MDLKRVVTGPVGFASRLANNPVRITGVRPPFAIAGPISRLTGQGLDDAVRDKVVLITGASSGIGEMTAERIGAARGTVVLVARGRDKLDETASKVERAGGIADVRPCDLTSYEAIDEMIAGVLDDHGRVDVLVNNAGRSIRRSIELSYDRFHDFERTMQLNYFAAIRLILGVLPRMRANRDGHVINISSIGVQTRVPRFSGYIASKAALDTWSDAVQAETRDDGVHFTTIHMPLVRTPMIAPTTIYKSFPTLTPEEAADTVCKAIVHKPRRVGPPFGQLAAFADAVSPEIMDVVRNRGYRMFPDSKAARGSADGKPEAEKKLGNTEQAFARATRGVHW